MDMTGIGTGLQAISSIIDKIFPDKTQAEKDQLALALAQIQAQIQSQQMQADVDKQEAASQSLFVAGWRPFIGWVCGTGFLFTILGPLISYIAALCGHVGLVFPTLDTESLMTLLLGMLGLGGYRTYEKVKGVSGTGH